MGCVPDLEIFSAIWLKTIFVVEFWIRLGIRFFLESFCPDLVMSQILIEDLSQGSQSLRQNGSGSVLSNTVTKPLEIVVQHV